MIHGGICMNNDVSRPDLLMMNCRHLKKGIADTWRKGHDTWRKQSELTPFIVMFTIYRAVLSVVLVFMLSCVMNRQPENGDPSAQRHDPMARSLADAVRSGFIRIGFAIRYTWSAPSHSAC